MDENINLSEKVVTNINEKTTVNALKEKITATNLTVVFKNISGNELEDSSYVGTGTAISFLREDGSEYDALTIKICGDVTGDGIINSADLLKTVKCLKGTTTIDEFAADVTKDSKVNSADLLKTVKYLKGTTTIDFK